MTTIENIRACVDLQVPETLPVFALSQEFDAKYCGLTYADYIRNAETIVSSQLRVSDKFGWDWAWLHLDEALEFEPLGVGATAGENVVPATTAYLPLSKKTLAGLKVPDPKAAGRMPLLLDALAGVREARGDRLCVTGRIAAPFTALTLIFGVQEAFLAMTDNPRLFGEALQFAEDLATTWGLAQIEAGAHAIWCCDCNASTHLISPALYEQWALEPCQRVCQAFKEAGAFAFLHNSEDSLEGLRLQALAQPSAVSSGPHVDRAAVAAALGRKICTIGNIDPVHLLQFGSASQVAAETDRQVRLMFSGGMILSSGDCVPREAKGPNLHTMVDSARKVWNLIQQH